MNDNIKQLNSLAIRQFELITNFIQVSKQLESILDEYRYNLSKTKSILGFATVDGLLEDNREMEPSIRIDVGDDGVFAINKTKSSGKTAISTFRPFGLLEPQSARNARKNISDAVTLICELAGVKNELLSVEQEYRQIRSKT